MSATPTIVTARHFEYIAAHTTPEDDFLKSLKDAATESGIPSIWISAEQGSFMQILLRLANARNVLEVGTLAGYSAIVMARALPDGGRVSTVELNEQYADFAASWIARSDVAKRVEIIRGDGRDILAGLAADSADAAFLDADKAGYEVYLKHCLRIVRRGGLIMVDNAFAFGQLFDEHPTDREAPAVKRFNEVMARQTGLQGIIAPFGDGLWVAVRL